MSPVGRQIPLERAGNIQGLNAVVNSVYKDYYSSFKLYHKYAILNHYSWLIRAKYDCSKRNSVLAARHIFKNCKFDLAPKVKEEMKECCAP